MSPMAVLAASVSALAIGIVAWALVPPPRRLRSRVEPYVAPKLIGLTGQPTSGAVRSVFGPIIKDLADSIGSRLDRAGSGVSLLRVRQAGLFKGRSEEQMLTAYRVAQLRSIVVGLLVALTIGQALSASLAVRLALAALALVIGATRLRARLERAIETRRERMKIEVYTVNQLLAMRVRAGGGVVQAVKATVERGSGEVVGELREALRLHRSGWRGPDAFRRIAELTPEPSCSRTYRLLATAEERGADLAGALLALSEDVRETRRESIKRTATKRRAAMLIPTIAILAPVLILFVAAPLPYLVTGWQ
jgi:tight adherence protein C